MSVLLVATRNRKKEKELAALLGDSGWEVHSLMEMEGLPEVIEDGKTFLENARKKATEVSAAVHCVTLADDSGLVVDALAGAPGVYSARYAALEGRPPSDRTNCECVLRELEAVPDGKRAARFVCAAVVAREGQVIFETEQVVEGRILREPRGSSGFGYDPIFFYPPFGATFAEVALERKQAVSHRSQALAEVCRFLRDYTT